MNFGAPGGTLLSRVQGNSGVVRVYPYIISRSRSIIYSFTDTKTMEWKIDGSSMPFYIRVETSGKASPERFAEMWDEVLASEHWRPGQTVLVDNRKLEPLKDADRFTEAGIEYFAKNAARFGKACIATISVFPENFKYARQFQYGTRLRGCDVVLQVFGSEKQAVDWLDHYGKLHSEENKTAAV
jgi:hypothetical protein